MTRDEAGRREKCARKRAVRQQSPREKIAEKPPTRAPGHRRRVGFDLRTAELEQVSEAYAGRACRFARATSKARVEMFGQEVVDGRAPFGDILHHEDPSARRVRLYAEQPVGRTRLLAHAATRADIEIGQLRAIRTGTRRRARDVHQIAPSMRPESSVPEASKADLSRRKSA